MADETTVRYEVVIRIPVIACDDVDARDKATKLVASLPVSGGSTKLQCIYATKAPRGVRLT